MSVYPDSHKIYVYLNEVRTDITGHVIGDIKGGDWGIMDNKPGTRVANTGYLSFMLNNIDNRYTPGSLTALSGWKKGIAIELEIVFEGAAYLYRFYISSITPASGSHDIVTRVTATDWLDYAAEVPIQNPGISLNQTGDSVLDAIINLMPRVPLNTDFDIGINVFPTTFDTNTSQTKAYDEAVKVALSELGRVYLQKDRMFGETLVFENATARNGTRTLANVPIAESASGFVLKAASGVGGTNHVLTPAGDRIILNQLQPLGLGNIMSFETDYGSDQINHLTMIANPRFTDETEQILFRLNAPIPVASGETVKIQGTYANPDGGSAINARDMIEPVPTTDYVANTLEDGTGSSLTPGIIVDASFGTEGFTHYVTNNSTAAGFIIQYNLRGYGIYIYNPIRYTATNLSSIEEYSTFPYTIDQKYKDTLAEAILFAERYVEQEGEPRTVIKKVGACANVSTTAMMAFLNAKIGDLFSVGFSKANISGYFYIDGMDDIVIGTGGMITFKWVVSEYLSFVSGSLQRIAVQFTSASGDALDFGFMPYLDNMQSQTLSAWVYVTSLDGNYPVIARFGGNDGGGWYWLILIDGKMNFRKNYSGNDGLWRTTNDVITPILNGWHHIAVTYNGSSLSNVPVFYVDGVSKPVDTLTAPTGTLTDDTSQSLFLGNMKYSGDVLAYRFRGRMQEARIYDRALTQAEITAIYHGGTPDEGILSSATDGPPLFHSTFVRTTKYDEYIDVILNEDMKIIDNVHGVVGTPIGTIYGRAP